MPIGALSCVKMDYDVQDGFMPRELIEYDFAEDALEFETQLAEARDVKFTQNLSEPLGVGSHIVCTGTPTDDLPWFAVNIGDGDVDGRGDIAVHFNVRLPQCYVVRNTRRHGTWGKEETTACKSFPFKPDEPFSIEVVVDEKETFWAVNGEPYCRYAHRNPSPLTATWVQISGIRDAGLSIQQTELFPAFAATAQEVPLRPYLNGPGTDEPTWRSNIVAALSKGIPDGYQLVIHGRLRPLLHSFLIDLTDGCHEWPSPRVLLHVNLRAHDDSQKDRQLVVMNTWFGSWGAERRQRSARLVPGTQTQLRILRGPNEWVVYFDDVTIGELEYRAAPSGVKALRVRGDIYPSQIYICPASNSPICEAINNDHCHT